MPETGSDAGTPNAGNPDTGSLFRMREAVEAAGDIVYSWDLEQDSVTWSGRRDLLETIIGDKEVTEGREFLRQIVPEDLIARRRALNAQRLSGEPFDCEYRLADSSGSTIWVNERGSSAVAEDGHPFRVTGTIRIVTDRKVDEARLKYEVRHDKLTGLYNRLRLTEAVDDILAFNQRYDRSGAYYVVGIDHLTLINNAFGHEAGDAVLIELAQRFDSRPPIGDAIGRIGGDCFGIVVADIDGEAIDQLGERILEEMRRAPVETPSGQVFVTASVGCAVFGGDSESAHDIMAKADVALRDAKLGGRNGYLRYKTTEALRAGQKESVAIAEKVLTALKDDRLLLAYQPIVTADTSEVAHYECLLRMINEEGEVVNAGVFIPVIEEMGLVRQIDERVMELAVKTLRDNPKIHLAVNVSAVTAGDPQWRERLVSMIKAEEGVAERIMIEITETMALRDVEDSARFVDSVRALGCQVALDDFGAGNTSFRNLRALPVDVVKIDGCFVRNIAEHPDNQLFLRSLVDLARGFGLKTVAECVETEADVDILKANGVDYMQGWYYGRPEVGRPWDPTDAEK